MAILDNLKTWYRSGDWLNTPQGICVLLSIPVCWIAALAAFFWPVETRPLFLSDGPILFILTPLLAFITFVRFGQFYDRQFSSSLFDTAMVLSIIGMPFYVPYLRG
jgi:hypothetical protein